MKQSKQTIKEAALQASNLLSLINQGMEQTSDDYDGIWEELQIIERAIRPLEDKLDELSKRN
ncbi:hypothetical protein ABMA58_00245 [Oceanospirillum sp. HFRX-1_2]